jgi:hypothetical protein
MSRPGCKADPNHAGWQDCNGDPLIYPDCPYGYKVDSQYNVVGVPGAYVSICKPDDGDDPVTDADVKKCINDGMHLFGPLKAGGLGLFEDWTETECDFTHPGAGCDYKLTNGLCTQHCNKYRGMQYQESDIINAWSGLKKVLFNPEWVNLAADKRQCAINLWRGTDGVDPNNGNYVPPDLEESHVNDIGYYLNTAAQCNACPYFPDTDKCDNPVTPLLPPWPGDIIPVVPPQPLCPLGQDKTGDCMGIVVPIPKPGPITPPFNFPSTNINPAPYVPDKHTSWWHAYWEEFLGWLAEWLLTPEYISMVLGACIPVWAITQSMSKTALIAATGLLGPIGYYHYRLFMKYVRDQIIKFENDHPFLIDMKYGILAGIVGEGALVGLMALEWEFDLPLVLIGETGIYGTLVVFIGAAVVWFLNTDLGKALTSAGGWIAKGIDDLIG